MTISNPSPICNLENSPILIAIESATDVSTLSFQTTTTFQFLQNFHNLNYDEYNRFEIAFSIAKTAINIALEINNYHKLIQILKKFIAIKHNQNAEGGINNNYLNKNNSVENYKSN
ncbi:hypothetical protein RhiirA5_438046 [Rhizophagus irregularis]|uniref:Uncharacterized protein n=1 Tax=Rhizophagus irregularis TaxID=588596 RepID=A0A2I1FGB3_9GLOM|nr:hypothetical protein RhiirA5_438046 [Rhizophagus irregularis]PKC53575.1 hypothetical protein RhiirA1_479029 [Rhizophagus irregularis]PKY33430.1 hypothetical protein RhiirB3_452315 [Rhizophagus irregularis]